MSAVNTLTYATKVIPIPKVLLQLSKSAFSKQKGYTENKYTETMTCLKPAANARKLHTETPISQVLPKLIKSVSS